MSNKNVDLKIDNEIKENNDLVLSEPSKESLETIADCYGKILSSISYIQNPLGDTGIVKICDSLKMVMESCKFDELSNNISDSVKSLFNKYNTSIMLEAIQESMESYYADGCYYIYKLGRFRLKI